MTLTNNTALDGSPSPPRSGGEGWGEVALICQNTKIEGCLRKIPSPVALRHPLPAWAGRGNKPIPVFVTGIKTEKD